MSDDGGKSSALALVEEAAAPARYEEPRELTIEEVEAQVGKIDALMQRVLKRDQHYGVIPGTGDKPTLLQPGAEKINLMFRIGPGKPEVEEVPLGGGHMDVKVTLPMIHLTTGRVLGYGYGSCSTMESKYRYRSASRKCPQCGKEAIIKGKEEYGGGWLCFAKKGGCGAKFAEDDAAITGQVVGKVENPDIADTYNTVRKIAYKRAYVGGTIKVTAASDFFTQDVIEEDDMERFNKAEWQRNHRTEFKEENGYSESAHYGAGGLRGAVLERDGYACVLCGMTDAQHKIKWNRPITVDHIDKDRTNNTMENLQTLCLSCHGAKDQKPELREPQVPEFKDAILQKRKAGATYQAIADEFGFSIASIWKWCQKWCPPADPAPAAPQGKPTAKAYAELVAREKKAIESLRTNSPLAPQLVVDKAREAAQAASDDRKAAKITDEEYVKRLEAIAKTVADEVTF